MGHKNQTYTQSPKQAVIPAGIRRNDWKIYRIGWKVPIGIGGRYSLKSAKKDSGLLLFSVRHDNKMSLKMSLNLMKQLY
jgi:hypothetical protein